MSTNSTWIKPVDQIVFTLDYLPSPLAILTFQLGDPAGNVVPSTSWDAVFSNIPNRHFGGRLSQPMPGAWKLEVTNQQSEMSSVPYQVIVSGLSNLTVDLLLPDRLNRRFTTGERVPIYALLSSNAPIAGSKVKAMITAPNNVVTTIPLFDDGQHDDGAADDGLYANFYTLVTQSTAVPPTGEKEPPVPNNEGSYRVLVTADGTAGDYPFHREAIGSFSVLAGKSRNQYRIPDVWVIENKISNLEGDNDMDGLLNWEEYFTAPTPTIPIPTTGVKATAPKSTARFLRIPSIPQTKSSPRLLEGPGVERERPAAV